MVLELHAHAHLEGLRIALVLTCRGEAEWSSVQVLRRRWAHPEGPSDGFAVLRLPQLFESPDQPWHRVERIRYLVVNSTAEGGLCQAEVVRCFREGETQPARATLRLHGDARTFDVIQFQSAPEAIEFNAPEFGGSCWLMISTPTPGNNELVLVTPSNPDSINFGFDCVNRWTTSCAVDANSPNKRLLSFSTVDERGERLCTVRIEESLNEDSGELIRVLTIDDAYPSNADAKESGLVPAATYYYAVWGGAETAHTSATVTGRHGFPDKLYQLLPSIHRQYDEPDPDREGNGQLRRFLQIFGVALDHARSTAESLVARHDVFHARGEGLMHLAQWIGWEPSRPEGENAQRQDILFAPKTFETTGTLPNIRALITRKTGWNCHIKEFSRNVFLTHGAEPIHLWELWSTSCLGEDDGMPGFHDPVPKTRAWNSGPISEVDWSDGRPAPCFVGTSLWLFWHSNRSGRRELWFQLNNDPPERVMQDQQADPPGAVDECPAVLQDGRLLRLFWSSNRAGNSNIWTRTVDIETGVWSAPERITDHPSENRNPTVVKGPSGHIWVFWESNRRGPTDIWATKWDPNKPQDGWDRPRRVTTGEPHDRSPCAVVDFSNNLRLFWSADRGWASVIRTRVVEGAEALDPAQDIMPPMAGVCCESPSVTLWKSALWLHFQCKESGGPFRLRVLSFASGSIPPTSEIPAAAELQMGSSLSMGDKDAATVVDARGTMHLFFRTQRGGRRFVSRTVDMQDKEALARIKARSVDDRTHYLHGGHYTGGSVGFTLTSNDGSPIACEQVWQVAAFVESFRPISTAQFYWFHDGCSDPSFHSKPFGRKDP